jgi:hypothetical protein
MTNMKQKKILVPTRSIEDWKSLLADPEKHWKSGYSAMLTANSWENAATLSGLPFKVESLFNSSDEGIFKSIELVFAIPEYKVSLKGGPRSSQNDVFSILTSKEGLISITVEAKAKEDFGPNINEWKQKVSDKGFKTRLRHIMENIGLQDTVPDFIRYQLLHRTASAVIEAKRFHAIAAVMIVQSFVKADSENHYDDYVKFIELYGKSATKEKLIFLSDVCNIRLFSAWVHSKPL